MNAAAIEAPSRKPCRLDLSLDELQGGRIGEHPKLAPVDEVDLRREEGRGPHAGLPPGAQPGERDREERAADAVADGVDLAFPGRAFDGIESGEDPVAEIVVEAALAMAFVGIDPGHHEHGVPLSDTHQATNEFRGRRSRM